MNSINQREKCENFFLSQKENGKKKGEILLLQVCNNEVLTHLGSQTLLDIVGMADARCDFHSPLQRVPLSIYTYTGHSYLGSL